MPLNILPNLKVLNQGQFCHTGHLAALKDIFGCDNLRLACYWHLVDRRQICCKHLRMYGTAPSRTHPYKESPRIQHSQCRLRNSEFNQKGQHRTRKNAYGNSHACLFFCPEGLNQLLWVIWTGVSMLRKEKSANPTHSILRASKGNSCVQGINDTFKFFILK